MAEAMPCGSTPLLPGGTYFTEKLAKRRYKTVQSSVQAAQASDIKSSAAAPLPPSPAAATGSWTAPAHQ